MVNKFEVEALWNIPKYVGQNNEKDSYNVMAHGYTKVWTPGFPKNQSKYRVCIEPTSIHVQYLQFESVHEENNQSAKHDHMKLWNCILINLTKSMEGKSNAKTSLIMLSIVIIGKMFLNSWRAHLSFWSGQTWSPGPTQKYLVLVNQGSSYET